MDQNIYFRLATPFSYALPSNVIKIGLVKTFESFIKLVLYERSQLFSRIIFDCSSQCWIYR